MAQPLFDQHPLEQYFRNTGETAEPMPGACPDFAAVEEDEPEYDDPSSPHVDVQLPEFVIRAIQIANDLLQSSTCTSRENSFEERFKYDVISSALLSSSLAAPTSTTRRSFTPEIPGKLDDGGGGSDGEHSPLDNHIDPATPESTPTTSNPNISRPELPIALLSIAVVFLSTGFYFLAITFLAASSYVWYVAQANHDMHISTSQTLHSLNELISAGNVWDSAVNEAIVLIENEERSIFYGPTSQRAPSSALRIALQSSLHTTQTQCDNVRQLLSALTDPTSLSQLTEMYAPPSPIRQPVPLGDNQRSPLSQSSTMRPFSHPSATPWRQRTTSLPGSDSINKRATWNGSYAALAVAGSPTAHLLERKQRNRRSDVLSLFQPLAPGNTSFASFSAPVSPQQPPPSSPADGSSSGRSMDVVVEEEDHETAEELEAKNYFGAAALDLRRKRRSAALETFGHLPPPPSYSSTPPKSPTRGGRPVSLLGPPTLSSFSSSRLTPVHTTRHPLSLSGLHLALQGALAAKRYACSYLLALRFGGENGEGSEDDGYWENARSVMALLSSTFSDASTRLLEALDEAEKRRKKDERPTPPRGNTPTPDGKGHVGRGLGHERKPSPLRHDFDARELMEGLASFAPMPSSMARLAGHLETISAALGDAREHIDECVGALRDRTVSASRRSSLEASTSTSTSTSNVQDHPAFQAYDRLRKELGFALRECERGRERLLDVLSPRPSALAEGEDEDASLNTPGLKHDSESETSERGPASPNVAADSGLGLTLSYDREGHQDVDDATAHLLLTASSQHLPPPGAEQVFEAESGNGGTFERPRSNLSREERIRLVKARRAGGQLPSTSSSVDFEVPAKRERWGPGGEVVQELKDVIWKVGERKRKMSQRVQQTPPAPKAESRVGEDDEETWREGCPGPVPVSDRETSICIEVSEGSPVAEVDDEPVCAPEPEPEATEYESESESELAYLDSPSPAPSRPLPRSLHADASCLALESASVVDMDDTLIRTVSHGQPASIPALVQRGLDMSVS